MLTDAQLDHIEGDALALVTAGATKVDGQRLATIAGAVPQMVAEIRAARAEGRAAEHAAFEAAIDGDAHAVTALLANLDLNALRCLAHAAQFTATAAHNRALALVMAGAGLVHEEDES